MIVLFYSVSDKIEYVTYTIPLCTLLLCWLPHLPACRPASLKSVSGFSNGIYLRGWDVISSPTPQTGEPDVTALVYGHLATKRSRHQQNRHQQNRHQKKKKIGHHIITLQ